MSTRREFLQGLAAFAAAVPQAPSRKAVRGESQPTGSTPDEGVVATLADGVLRIDWRLSKRSGQRLRVPPAQATYLVAIAQASQRPLYCRLLADVAGSKVTGPQPVRGGVGYRATVPVTSLGPWKKGTPILLHASFWEHHSAVVVYQADA